MEATEFHTKAFKYVQTYKHIFIFLFLKIKELRTIVLPKGGFIQSEIKNSLLIAENSRHFPGKE